MLPKKTIFIVVGVLIVIFAGFILAKKNRVEVGRGTIELEGMGLPQSDLSGEKCENAKYRPVAVMISSDPEARPLSGIGQADMVFEMPVTDGGVTRMMAVFQCHHPQEIGSIRSARSDFIPWAQGLGAVYAHWGGEHHALDNLNAGIINNIDGLKYEGVYYFRKNTARPPHNGFTSFDLINQANAKLGYTLGKSNTVYQHQDGKRPSGERGSTEASKPNVSAGTIEPPVIYEGNFMVQWPYQSVSNTYKRLRAGKEEIDHNTLKPVEVSNVILLKTTWLPISKDYINVQTTGSGEAVIYKNGEVIDGTWEKKLATDRLVFYDQNHQEIKFTIGKIWVETLIK